MAQSLGRGVERRQHDQCGVQTERVMVGALDERMLEALLDSWDRSNSVGRAIWEGA